MDNAWQDPHRTWMGLGLVLGLALMPTAGLAQTRGDVPAPTASEGGKVERLPVRSVPEALDPLNQRVLTDTAEGLVLSVLIDGATITLNSASPARVPRRLAKAERTAEGPMVKATGYSGGQVVAVTVLPDTLFNAAEGAGLVRTERRQVSLVLVADRPMDTVTVEAPATGASASLDLRSAYSRYCDADRNGKWCPKARDQPSH